jgi:DNA-binding LytR/AlgR family response regulator
MYNFLAYPLPDYFMNTTTQHPGFIFVRKQQTLHRVNLSEIRYVNAEGNYCYLMVADDKKFAIKISLRQLQKELPEDQFVRIHKSYLVNVSLITHLKMKERQAYLNEEVIPIGRTYMSDLTERLQIV